MVRQHLILAMTDVIVTLFISIVLLADVICQWIWWLKVAFVTDVIFTYVSVADGDHIFRGN